MIGAIAGDIIGSYYEGYPTKNIAFQLFPEFCRFTDDSVLTVAVAEWILQGGSLVDHFHNYFEMYPQAGYGMSFTLWAGNKRRDSYGSWGNGSAMRVSPIGQAYDTLREVLEISSASAKITHDHPEGVRGAQAVAAAVFLARTGMSKADIKAYLQTDFGYNLDRTIDQIRPNYSFDESCQGSVPQSIIAFLESSDYETAVRLAVSLGGDADTMACIAGGIAEAYYKSIPEHISTKVNEMIDSRLMGTVERFVKQYPRLS